MVLTNDSGADISVAGFAFEVTVSDPDITLVGADYATVDPYIFASDSFVQENATLIESFCSCSCPLSSPAVDTAAQTLVGSDVTGGGEGITVANGSSVGLGDVLFDVADDAAPGSFTVSFTGSSSVADSNNMTDADFNAIPIDTFSSGTIDAAEATPEPGTALLLAGALGILGLLRRQR